MTSLDQLAPPTGEPVSVVFQPRPTVAEYVAAMQQRQPEKYVGRHRRTKSGQR